MGEAQEKANRLSGNASFCALLFSLWFSLPPSSSFSLSLSRSASRFLSISQGVKVGKRCRPYLTSSRVGHAGANGVTTTVETDLSDSMRNLEM